MSTKKERMYQRIEEHGNKLIKAFGLQGADSIELCKKLRRIETAINKFAYHGACTTSYTDKEIESFKNRMLKRLSKILGDNHGLPVFINLDPRGHGLKIDDEKIETPINLPRDGGGYYIIAPDLTESEAFNG